MPMQISQYNLVSQIISEAVSLLPTPTLLRSRFAIASTEYNSFSQIILIVGSLSTSYFAIQFGFSNHIRFQVLSGQRQTFPKSLSPVRMAFVFFFKMPIFSLRCSSRHNAAVQNTFSGLFLPMQLCNIIQSPELYSMSCLFGIAAKLLSLCPPTIAAYPQINVECRQIFWSPGQDLHLPYSLH